MNQEVPECFKNINNQKDLLKTLSNCKRSIRLAIIKKADKALINTICECCFNLLEGNIDLTEEQHKNLLKYKNTLRKLVLKSNLKEKKKIISQQGGFLQFLIPAVVTGISTIISSLIDKKNNKSN
jgi:hypothetical protein